jgi:hypothetical protein
LFHVERVPGLCECEDILCVHGWAPRFVLAAIAREGTHVGASNIDFSALFIDRDTDQEHAQEADHVGHLKFQPRVETVLETRRQPRNEQEKRREIEREVDADMASVLSEHLEKRTMMIEKMFAEMVAAKQEQFSPGGAHEDTGDEVASTIMPGHSSSVVERYMSNQKFMPTSAYVLQRKSTVLEPVSEESNFIEPRKDVVAGFVKTNSMMRVEKASNDRVYLINGLAAPFKDSRLNFLIHFHTALHECSFNPQTDPIDALEELGNSRPKNPTGELICQVVRRTFDFDEQTIIANPFNLPFIEVGMNITDSVVLKTLDLLRIEYKSLWFAQMKCLRVPGFHSEYRQLSTEVFKSGSRRGSRVSPSRDVLNAEEPHQVKPHRSDTQKRHRRPQSILGFRA